MGEGKADRPTESTTSLTTRPSRSLPDESRRTQRCAPENVLFDAVGYRTHLACVRVCERGLVCV